MTAVGRRAYEMSVGRCRLVRPRGVEEGSLDRSVRRVEKLESSSGVNLRHQLVCARDCL